jgi:RNA polymerase sigma factor (TIGR02999 family)
MRRENPGHTLQPTALVHEAFLKLSSQRQASWKSRTHFFAVGASVMKRLLIDHARKRAAARRGAGWQRETLSNEHETCQSVLTSQENLLVVNQALDRLAAVDQRGARVIALRVFAGLTVVEVAETLGISPRTVNEDWRHALAWLRLELSGTCDA